MDINWSVIPKAVCFNNRRNLKSIFMKWPGEVVECLKWPETFEEATALRKPSAFYAKYRATSVLVTFYLFLQSVKTPKWFYLC